MKSEDVWLNVCVISIQDFQPMWSWSINVTDRWTDRQMDDMRIAIALCTIVHHHTVKNNNNKKNVAGYLQSSCWQAKLRIINTYPAAWFLMWGSFCGMMKVGVKSRYPSTPRWLLLRLFCSLASPLGTLSLDVPSYLVNIVITSPRDWWRLAQVCYMQ